MRVNFRQLFLLLILLSILVVLVGPMVINYRVEQGLNQLAAKMRAYGHLRHGDVQTDLRGNVHIHGLDITFFQPFNDKLSVAQVIIVSPGYMELARKAIGLDSGHIPSHLDVSLLNVTSREDGELVEKLNASAEAYNARVKSIVKPACGEVQAFGPADFGRLGFEFAKTNIDFSYQYSEGNRSLLLDFDAERGDMWNFNGHLEFSALPHPQNFFDPEVKPPSVMADITYNDLLYFNRWVKHCAQANQMSEEDFIRWESGRDNLYYAVTWGIIPGKALLDAYRSFLSQPESIRLRFEYDSSVELGLIGSYTQTDLPLMFGLQVDVNGRSLPSLEFKSVPQDLAAANKVRFDDVKVEPEAYVPVREAVVEDPPYRDVALEELGNFVGREIRVLTSAGQLREGILVRVGEGELEVDRVFASGRAKISIPVPSVTRIELKKQSNR